MAELDKRPTVLIEEKDINKENLEKIFQNYDKVISDIDSRRVTQQETVSHASGASDSDKIDNLTAAINSLIAALNGSDLTND